MTASYCAMDNAAQHAYNIVLMGKTLIAVG
jgi:hypothetical protein